jgi:hypothetical protein
MPAGSGVPSVGDLTRGASVQHIGFSTLGFLAPGEKFNKKYDWIFHVIFYQYINF